MRSERQVLARIAKLHFLVPYSEDGPASEGFCPQCDVVYPCETAAILADVQPDPASQFPRDEVREALESWQWWAEETDSVKEFDRVLDRLAALWLAPAGGTIDRDTLDVMLGKVTTLSPVSRREVIEHILALVRPVGGTIDRGELISELSAIPWPVDYAYAADRILALVRPVEGVVLTREECEHAADWHDYIVDQGGAVPAEETELALRIRAGAAS